MRLLIVGTLEGYITAAGQIAMSRGARVAHTDSIDGALHALRNGAGADLVMIDVKLDVARMVDSLKSERINMPVVACGVGTDAKAAVRAIHAGAKEYVPLPPDADLIAAVLEAVAEDSTQLISRDPAMGQVLRVAEQIAPSDASVLVTGESGTGKEVMARYIHNKSRRSGKAFVSVNCAAIPENLLESELFGHEKGAFTGAMSKRIGKFEEANGGTLLLDEIGEMDPRLQAKLLRAIQERVIDRVGGNQPVRVDIRLIATTNRNLEDEVRKGTFREDLYFRLNVMHLVLPPLRARPLDIAVLTEYFVRKYSEANGMPIKAVSVPAQQKLLGYAWRGNVRELENTIHRAVLLSRAPELEPDAILLTSEMLGGGVTAAQNAHQAQRDSAAAEAQRTPTPPPAAVAAPPTPPAHQAPPAGYGAYAPPQTTGYAVAPPTPATTRGGATLPPGLVGRTVADVERDLIIDTLGHCLGNRTHAANILGISIRTLRNKLKQYGDEGFSVPPPGSSEPADISA
jgi:two-component system, response regulator FlrC